MIKILKFLSISLLLGVASCQRTKTEFLRVETLTLDECLRDKRQAVVGSASQLGFYWGVQADGWQEAGGVGLTGVMRFAPELTLAVPLEGGAQLVLFPPEAKPEIEKVNELVPRELSVTIRSSGEDGLVNDLGLQFGSFKLPRRARDRAGVLRLRVLDLRHFTRFLLLDQDGSVVACGGVPP